MARDTPIATGCTWLHGAARASRISYCTVPGLALPLLIFTPMVGLLADEIHPSLYPRYTTPIAGGDVLLPHLRMRLLQEAARADRPALARIVVIVLVVLCLCGICGCVYCKRRRKCCFAPAGPGI